MSSVDVLIVGSGQAGVPLATRLAEQGKSVLVVERGHLGGTCVNTGCTPTKTLIASARAAHSARRAGRLGVDVSGVKVDFAAVMARKDAIVERWRRGVESRLALHAENLRVVRGAARFVAERTIEVDGERHRGEIVVINAGVRPLIPSLPGLKEAPFLTNSNVLELLELPRRLLILGGGYIGCEFAQMFRRFGSEVVIVERGEHLLGREDPDTSQALEEVFRSEGIELVLGDEVTTVSHEDDRVALRLRSGERVEGTQILVALGRSPNSDELGCKMAGIDTDPRGFIVVDEGFATSAEGVYAVGDICGGPQFTHTSWDDHRLLFARLQGQRVPPRSERLIPYTVFTDPQVAGVGLNEREARERGLRYEVATLPFGQIARAIELDEPAGTLKVLIDPQSEKVVGCRLVGAEAGELLHIFVALMQAGATARAIVDAEFVHPTFAEGIQSLVMRLPRYRL